jgi:hypothetical protein
MSVEEKRILIGCGPGTPNGKWYDADCVPPLTAYLAAYRTYDNPATNSRVAFDNLKEAERAFYPIYRDFYLMVKHTPYVSDATLEEMGFPPHPSGERSAHPVNKSFIAIFVRPLANLVIQVSFRDCGTNRSAVPYYLTGAMIYYVVSDTPVTNPNLLQQSFLATRSPRRLSFDPKYRGKTVYLAARWQNRRGELGPWSEIVAAIIP